MDCFVGAFTGEPCHKQDYVSVPKEVIRVSELSEDDQILLKLRISKEIDSVCQYHKYKYLVKFHHIFGKKCCDPLNNHKKPVKNGLRKILLHHLSKPKNVPVDLIPGKSLCPNCATKIFVQKELEDDKVSEDDAVFTPQSYELIDNTTLEKVNAVCESLQLSPMCKVMKMNKDQRHVALLKKTENIKSAFKRKLEESFSEELEESMPATSATLEDEYEKLINKLKEKCKVASKDEKVKILSLLPDSWSRHKISKEFNVSEYLVRLTKELVMKQGILPNISKREGYKLSEEVINCVIEFYHDDLNSRLCPGKKDCVSMGKIDGERIYKQKRLILLSLNELYSLFKEKLPDIKIGRSMFCSLRPKWCVLPGSSGTHSVCVCKYHQNTKLMIEAVQINATYRDLLDFLVCDVNNKSCMFNQCSECAGSETLLDLLSNEIDEMPQEICFKQWVTVDRAELITQIKPTDEFLELLVENLSALKTHHFIAKIQSQYLKEVKERLTSKECVVLADFAENYTFTVQDEIQSYHWNNQQATIHPFVYYYKNDEKICCRNLCIISNHLVHDTISVYTFQKQLINDIKNISPTVEKVIYFTDGSGSQYKNKKNFVNVCHHAKDFGMQAEWNFFASSHGKNACDGVGATTKREITKISLRRPYTNQILTPKDMFECCSEKFSGIAYLYVSEEEVEDSKKKLERRFQLCQRIPGTRGYHRFVPLSETVIRCFVTSTCEEYDDHNISNSWESSLSFGNNDHIACIYDNQWWIGKVLEVSRESNDLSVHFFYPCGPKTSFKLSKNDTVWVPISRVLRKLTPLELTTITGRTYNITDKLCNEISELFISVSAK